MSPASADHILHLVNFYEYISFFVAVYIEKDLWQGYVVTGSEDPAAPHQALAEP